MKTGTIIAIVVLSGIVIFLWLANKGGGIIMQVQADEIKRLKEESAALEAGTI